MGGVERREEPVTSNTVFSKFLVGFICPVRWHPQDDGRYGAEAVAAAVWRTTSSATSPAVVAQYSHCRLKNNINKSQPGSSGHRMEVSTPWGQPVRGVPTKRKKELRNVKVLCFQVVLLYFSLVVNLIQCLKRGLLTRKKTPD